jgi:small subunit ribosomal protein S20
MANIKSQIKRNRQNERARVRNKSVRSALKTSQKKVRTAADGGELETASAQNREAARALDQAVSAGVIHKRTAARRKSRLAKQVARASQTS